MVVRGLDGCADDRPSGGNLAPRPGGAWLGKARPEETAGPIRGEPFRGYDYGQGDMGFAENPAPAPQVIRWRDFWPALDQCGQAGWPQLIRVPGRLIDFKRAYPHQEVVWMFRAEEDVLSGGPDINEPFVTLEPDADGNYQVTEDPSDGFDRPAAGRSEDHRLVVFLDARALRPAWNG
jgi:hypothetical protein